MVIVKTIKQVTAKHDKPGNIAISVIFFNELQVKIVMTRQALWYGMVDSARGK